MCRRRFCFPDHSISPVYRSGKRNNPKSKSMCLAIYTENITQPFTRRKVTGKIDRYKGCKMCGMLPVEETVESL
jgi:hypothetical protein